MSMANGSANMLNTETNLKIQNVQSTVVLMMKYKSESDNKEEA